MIYTDKGSVATDKEDGDLTDSIVVTGADAVDLSTVGTYEVLHSVTDSDGATSEITRTIHVLPEADYDFQMEVTTLGPISLTYTGTLPEMLYSIDGGDTFYPVSSGGTVLFTGIVVLKGKNIETVSPGTVTNWEKVHVNKAFTLTTAANMFKNATGLTKFTTSTPNIFPNVTNMRSMFERCGALTSVGAMNYNAVTDTTNMFIYTGALVCIEGTIEVNPAAVTSSMFYATNLSSPNAAERSIITTHGSWTNPGTCP